MIEKSSGYTSNGADFHATLEDAQMAALQSLAAESEIQAPGVMANFVIRNRVAIAEILNVKAKGRPRKNADTTKPRKAKLRTAALPLVEKERA